MNEIKKQVAKANRCLTLQLFYRNVIFTMLFALACLFVAVTAPKIWVFDFLTDPAAANTWNISWLIGCFVAALVAAGIITYFKRQSLVETAVTVDREFGLRERLSSALALQGAELETEAGQALLKDAQRRADRIDVSEKFKLSADWRIAIPVLLTGFLCAIAFGIQNAQAEESDPKSTVIAQQKKATREAEESLRKKLRQQLKDARKAGLKDAEIAFEEINAELNKLNSGKTSTKKTLSKLNDMKEQLKKRQKKIGNTDAIKKQLNKMNNIQKGAADKVADSLKSGDYNKAKDAIKELADKIANDKLSSEEKKQLAEQMSQMADQLKKMTAENEAKKQELKEKIEQAQQQGDLDSAARMQNQLDQMNENQNQMEQMNELAKQMQNAAQALKDGKGLSDQQKADAQKALSKMGDKLEQMQQDLDSMEALEGMQEQLSEAKSQCQGGNCPSGQEGDGSGTPTAGGAGKGDGTGSGMREGQGSGDRPEEESKTSFYDSKVKGKVKQGEAVIAGKVNGETIKGASKMSTREQIQASISQESDPQTDLRLPRAQRDHAKEYFERLRKGE